MNPAAGKGAARRSLEQLTQAFAAFGIVHRKQTQARGDEERLTREALDEGWTTIAVVGGDGTCSRVAHTLVTSRSNCALAVVPAGTGNDFAKTLGVGDFGTEQIAALVAGGDSTPIDVGSADDHVFINSCGFGFDASVLEASARVRLLSGDAVYIYAALRQLFTYRGASVSIEGSAAEKALMVTISNGRSLGGVFLIAPNASVADGALDVCVIGDASVFERVRLFAAAFRGTHERMDPVRTFTTRAVSLRFDAPPAIEIDGELRQAKTEAVTITCIPRALNVIMSPNARSQLSAATTAAGLSERHHRPG